MSPRLYFPKIHFATISCQSIIIWKSTFGVQKVISGCKLADPHTDHRVLQGVALRGWQFCFICAKLIRKLLRIITEILFRNNFASDCMLKPMMFFFALGNQSTIVSTPRCYLEDYTHYRYTVQVSSNEFVHYRNGCHVSFNENAVAESNCPQQFSRGLRYYSYRK